MIDDAVSARLGAEVAANHRAFERLVAASTSALRVGAAHTGAVFAYMAGQLAWQHHAGIFASPRLERLLARLGRRRVAAAPGTVAAPWPRRAPERILHVLTEAYQVGGHTRLVWRWIEQDPGRTHSIALTRQRRRELPAALETAVARAGGRIDRVDAASRDLVKVAAALRAAACRADLVVLHVHPDDVVPTIAFADRRGLPPVALLNHADHVFWLGVRTTDLFIDLRASGAALSAERRGVAPGTSCLAPLPLDPVERTMSREEAKRALGIAPERLVLLSVASEYKYTPIGALDFAAAVVPLVAARPAAEMLVVGPSPQGRWAEIARETGGRIRALGVQSELATLWQAADVYVDSFPFTSRTSWFEAALFGTPVLGLAWRGVGADVLFADDPGVPDELVAATDRDEFAARLARLMDDPGERRARGERVARDIEATHGPAAFRSALEAVYAAARRVGPAPPAARAVPNTPRFEPVDLLLQGLHRETEYVRHGYGGVLGRHRKQLPWAVRQWVKTWSMWKKP